MQRGTRARVESARKAPELELSSIMRRGSGQPDASFPSIAIFRLSLRVIRSQAASLVKNIAVGVMDDRPTGYRPRTSEPAGGQSSILPG